MICKNQQMWRGRCLIGAPAPRTLHWEHSRWPGPVCSEPAGCPGTWGTHKVLGEPGRVGEQGGWKWMEWHKVISEELRLFHLKLCKIFVRMMYFGYWSFYVLIYSSSGKWLIFDTMWSLLFLIEFLWCSPTERKSDLKRLSEMKIIL